MFEQHDRSFLVSLTYLGTYERFILYVMVPDDEATASRYKVTISMEVEDSLVEEKQIFVKDVVSIETMRNTLIHELEPAKCIVLTRTEALRYMKMVPNKDNDFVTIQLPINIEDVDEI